MLFFEEWLRSNKLLSRLSQKKALLFAFTLLWSFLLLFSIQRRIAKPSLTPNSLFTIYSSESRSDLKYVLLSSIAAAKSSLFLASFGFSDRELLALLKKKALERVPIHIIYDKSYPPRLPKEGIELTKDTKSGLMHRKITIIDGYKIFLGSTNSTEPSLKLHNNLLLYMEDQDFAEAIKAASLYQTDQFSYLPLPDEKAMAISSLIELIDGAKNRIDLAMYTFTHMELASKLVEAQKRGVTVRVTTDWGMAKGTSRKVIKLLRDHNIPIYQQWEKCLFHHKCALIDDTFVMGSVNWTKSGFNRNREYMLIFHTLNQKDLKKVRKFFSNISYKSKRLSISKGHVTRKSWRIPYFPSRFLSSCLWIPSETSPYTSPYYAPSIEIEQYGSCFVRCA